MNESFIDVQNHYEPKVESLDASNHKLKNLDSIGEQFIESRKNELANNYQKFMKRVYKFQNKKMNQIHQMPKVKLERNNSFQERVKLQSILAKEQLSESSYDPKSTLVEQMASKSEEIGDQFEELDLLGTQTQKILQQRNNLNLYNLENSSHEITYHEIDLNMTTREGDPRDSAILNGVLRAQRVGSIEILSENSFDKKLEFLMVNGKSKEFMSYSLIIFHIFDQVQNLYRTGDFTSLISKILAIFFLYSTFTIQYSGALENFKTIFSEFKKMPPDIEIEDTLSNSSSDIPEPRVVESETQDNIFNEENVKFLNCSYQFNKPGAFSANMKDIKSEILFKHFQDGALLCKIMKEQKTIGVKNKKTSETCLNQFVSSRALRHQLYGISRRSQLPQKLKLELIGKHTKFFEGLPFFQGAKNNIGTFTLSQNQSVSSQSQSFAFSIGTFGKQLSSEQSLNISASNGTTCEMEHYLLNFKIYQPFFISNSTIIAYQLLSDEQKLEKFSIMDILNANQNKGNQKLYFKVNTSDEIFNGSILTEQNNNENNYSHRSQQVNLEMKRMPMTGPMEEIKEGMSENERSLINQELADGGLALKNEYSIESDDEMSEPDSSERISDGYLEVRAEDLSESKFSQNYTGEKVRNSNNDENVLYYEFELKQLSNDAYASSSKDLMFLNIKDISAIIKGFQKIQDDIYLNAIENNFSHELMTPLNPIITSSEMLKRGLIQAFKEDMIDERFLDNIQIEGHNQNTLNQIGQNREACNLLKNVISIEQSAKSMWYFNTNQIIRQKLMKNQLKNDPQEQVSILEAIMKVIWPFEYFIFQRRINIYLVNNLYKGFSIVFDSKMYKLILFNLLQNGVKFNQTFDGDVVIILDCKPSKDPKHLESEEKVYIMETQVIDTGYGISKDRQKLLFVPLKEIRESIGGQTSKNENIGLGLSCCKIMVNKMGGDIKLQKSQRGMTAFSFKFPVKLNLILEESNEMFYQSNHSDQFQPKSKIKSCSLLVGKERPFPGNIAEYMRSQRYGRDILENDRFSKSSKCREIMNKKMGFRHIDQFEKMYPSDNEKKKSHSSTIGMKIINQKSSSLFRGHGQSLSYSNFNKSVNSFKEEQKMGLISRVISHGSVKQILSKSELVQGSNVNNNNLPIGGVLSQRQKPCKPILKKKNQLIEAISKNEIDIHTIDRTAKLKMASLILSDNQGFKIQRAIQKKVQNQSQIIIVEDESNKVPEKEETIHDIFVNIDEQERAKKQERRRLRDSDSVSESFSSESDCSLLHKSKLPEPIQIIQVEEEKKDEGKIEIEEIKKDSVYDQDPKHPRISDGYGMLHIIHSDHDNEESISCSRMPSCGCRSRILIVDDTEYNMLAVQVQLEEYFDISPELAQNGQIAVDKVQSLFDVCSCQDNTYKLIIMDIQMPVMDGYQASEIILKMHKLNGKETSIVALTSFTSETVIKKCEAIGMKEVIHKPLKNSDLQRIIAKYFIERQ